MYRKYAEEAMDIVKTIEADGPRLPGSDEEKAACKKLVSEIDNRLGLKAATESFIYAPEASIGAINKLGWVAALLLIPYYFGAEIIAMVGYIGIMVFVLTQIVVYTGIWDFCFKKAKSTNIITELPPTNGKSDYTVFLGAHYDSSWCWKLAAKNPATAIVKTAYGIFGAIAMIVLSLIAVLNRFDVFDDPWTVSIVTYVLPVAFLPGFFFVSNYLTQDKTEASPGAMDNLSGIALNMMVMKYFKEHPEELPEGMKLVNIGFAAEITGDGAQAHPDDDGDEYGHEPDGKRNARADDHPAEQVAAIAVGAQVKRRLFHFGQRRAGHRLFRGGHSFTDVFAVADGVALDGVFRDGNAGEQRGVAALAAGHIQAHPVHGQHALAQDAAVRPGLEPGFFQLFFMEGADVVGGFADLLAMFGRDGSGGPGDVLLADAQGRGKFGTVETAGIVDQGLIALFTYIGEDLAHAALNTVAGIEAAVEPLRGLDPFLLGLQVQNSANHGIYLKKRTPPEGAWTRGIARRTNIAKACANVETSVQEAVAGVSAP